MGRTFQITSIFRRLTALENVQTALPEPPSPALQPPACRRAASTATRRWRCWNAWGSASRPAKPSGILAHGDQRRLELAIALASAPQLLLLDEPTAGMAPRERHEIMALVARIAGDTGLTVVFTEHDMDVVFAVARRITVLHQGAVLAEGAPRRGPGQRRRAARVPRAQAAH